MRHRGWVSDWIACRVGVALEWWWVVCGHCALLASGTVCLNNGRADERMVVVSGEAAASFCSACGKHLYDRSIFTGPPFRLDVILCSKGFSVCFSKWCVACEQGLGRGTESKGAA